MVKKKKRSANTSLQLVTTEYRKEGKHYQVDELDQIYQEAVFLRIEGAEYQYIAKRLKFSYTHIRKIFATGGVCKPAYEELLGEITLERRKRFEKLQTEIEESAPEAFTYLRQFAKTNYKAAESLLHIAGYVPVQKLKAEIENPNAEKAASAIEDLATYARSALKNSNKETA